MPLTIQSKRRGTSIYFEVTLSDNQIVVNWTDLDIKDVFMYSEAQRSYAGRCTYEIDSEDPSKLHVTYPADKQQYLGLHRLVVRVVLEGTEATYDAPAINLVASMEQAATPVVSEEVAIGIEITEVDTTILHEILRACQQATDAANAAVAEAEQAIEDAEAATTAANAAAAQATEKAAAAQSAATAATNAAALANEKAALANEAAAAAQQAKTAADEAAAAALEAKEAADESAENADAKAALAQQAANSANTAATLAENRATEAHEAAAAATVAKNAANTAAAAAQAAATEATSAADEASAKAILASDAAQTATQAATLANTKAGEAGNAAAAANTAASAATTAASSATSAASAATTAAGSATTAAESANAAAELANEAAAAAQEAADTVEAFIANFEHAYLEGQRVGVADNIAPQGEGSEVEFTSRALTDVEENSVAMFPKIMGRSLVWNQVVKRSGEIAITHNGITYTPNADGSITINGTANGVSFYLLNSLSIPKGHYFAISGSPGNGVTVWDGYSFADTGNGAVRKSDDHDSDTYIGVEDGVSVENVTIKPCTNDLTKMYGAGNEPTTYAEFLQRKPIVEDEFAFDNGTIVNYKVEKVVSTEVNIWNEEWETGRYNTENGLKEEGITGVIRSKELMPCMPNVQYYFTCLGVKSWMFMLFYDAEKKFISSQSCYARGASLSEYDNPITSPANARYIAFNFGSMDTYNHDICINISDPSINGQYFPYEEHTLDLSWIREIKDENGVALFEDGMRSASSAYDEVGAKKAVKRLIVKVLDGTEGSYDAGASRYLIEIPGIKRTSSSTSKTNAICSQYQQGTLYEILQTQKDKIFAFTNTNDYLQIRDYAFDSIESWKAHLADLYAQGNPIVVICELATPIVVEYPAQNLCVKQTTGGVMTVEAGTGQNTTPFRALLVNGLNAFGRLMAIGKTSELQTTAKTVVGAINELYAMIINAAAQSTE